jgi:hypothetical protein
LAECGAQLVSLDDSSTSLGVTALQNCLQLRGFLARAIHVLQPAIFSGTH